MSLKIRMLPVGGQRTAWAGSPENPQARRYYSASPGQTVDVPENDASVIASQGFVAVGASGATADRPNNHYLKPGYSFIDTDLALVAAWDGTGWRNVVTGAEV